MKILNIHDTLCEVNNRSRCEACRHARLNFRGVDRKFDAYSNMIPGFYSATYPNLATSHEVDVMIIGDSHGGGGGEEVYREQYEADKEIDLIRNYYLQETFDSYHQEQMYLLFTKFDKNRVSWYFTDLLKCFVAREKATIPTSKKKEDNFKLATEHCKHYLEEQLSRVRSKVIITLGGHVFGEIKKLLKFNAPFLHGNFTRAGDTTIISSYFPSERRANLWVKKGKWRPIETVLEETLVKKL
jgi:hypothetical protein